MLSNLSTHMSASQIHNLVEYVTMVQFSQSFNKNHCFITTDAFKEIYNNVLEEIDTIQKLILFLNTLNNPNPMMSSLIILMATRKHEIFKDIQLEEYSTENIQLFKNTHKEHIWDAHNTLLYHDEKFFNSHAFDYMSVFFDNAYMNPYGFIALPTIGKPILGRAISFKSMVYINHFIETHKYSMHCFAETYLYHDNLEVYKKIKATNANETIPFEFTHMSSNRIIRGFHLAPCSLNIGYYEYSTNIIDPNDKILFLEKLIKYKYFQIIQYIYDTCSNVEREEFITNIRSIVRNCCSNIQTVVMNDTRDITSKEFYDELCPVIADCLNVYLKDLDIGQCVLACVYFGYDLLLNESFDFGIVMTELLVCALACSNIKYFDRVFVSSNIKTKGKLLDETHYKLIGNNLTDNNNWLFTSLKTLLKNNLIDEYDIFEIFLYSKCESPHTRFELCVGNIPKRVPKWYVSDPILLLKTIEKNNYSMFKIFEHNPVIIIKNYDEIQKLLNNPIHGTGSNPNIKNHCKAIMR